ncbi:NUDIX hydrolase [Micromonospora siamensis]|uniref:ADP-ribose pyrophosphatase YjhB, NUDIX family n=1 Tax=Micromonospora siamensis TaxID=299152 RepID=A0A1C5HNB7_9ACTN|nr:NUDIX domain-containing protein [Micromonospora siamensis]SCG47407.1 ADP-ribose pyrophosphatase YjhB, NUDIX family [Micromonospora siamensis]
MTVYTPRRAARVLLVDGAGRVLLFVGVDPARPEHRYWFTPGGGLEPGETYPVAAARELAEETGLRLPPTAFGAPVHRDVTEFPFDGVWYRQDQEFFLVRVDSHDVDTMGFNEIERASMLDHRWWSEPELAATGERYYPPDLPAILRRALAGPPAAPRRAVPAPPGPPVGSIGPTCRGGGEC